MRPPLKLAVIGAGPSAFYVTSRLLTLLGSNPNVRVHVYDRLWAPYGLVRYGVAPDHPEVKNCTHKFDAVASDPRVRFFGNVNVVASFRSPTRSSTRPPHTLQLPLQQLTPYYTHLLLATGAPIPKLHPALPPSHLCIPALDIVHWYTRHPFSSHANSTTSSSSSPLPPSPTHLTIVGHGNVSLDILRILLTPPATLSNLDIPASALAALSSLHQSLRHISVIGRRGPQDVRFGARELREVMKIDGATMIPIPEEEFAVAEGRESAGTNGGGEEHLTRQQTRILKLLREGSKRSIVPGDKTFSIEFYKTPAGYTAEGEKALLRLTRTSPGAPPTFEVLPTDLIITSLGYERDPTLSEALHADYEVDLNTQSVAGGTAAINDASSAPSTTVSTTTAAESGVTTSSASLRDLTSNSRSSGDWGDMSEIASTKTETSSRPIISSPSPPPNFPSTATRTLHTFISGWAAHGARGVLAGTLIDAAGVASDIVKDWEASTEAGAANSGGVAVEVSEGADNGCVGEGRGMAKGSDVHLPSASHIPGGIDSVPEIVKHGLAWRQREQEYASSGVDALSTPPVIEFSDWLLIDEEERGRGEKLGKERERIGWWDVVQILRKGKGQVETV